MANRGLRPYVVAYIIRDWFFYKSSGGPLSSSS